MNLKNTSNMYRQISRKGVQKRIKRFAVTAEDWLT
jgi:hypothetical protein